MLRVLLLLAVTSCSDSASDRVLHELVGTTMGTTFSIKLIRPDSEFDGSALQQEIEEALARLDARFSTYKMDSELSEFNATHSIAPIAVSNEFCDVVNAATRVSHITDGAFDITVGPLVNLWGFGPDGHISALPDNDAIAAAMATVGHQNLHVDCSEPSIRKDIAELTVDLSAYAKGYAVDQVVILLDESDIADFLVEIGGELRAQGRNGQGKLWAVGIESPSYTSRTVQSVIELNNTGIATSGDYRNYFEIDGVVYSHTIDPHTGYPVAHTAASVSVIDASAAFADAMATALLVLGPERGFELAEREGIAAIFLLRVDADFQQRVSTQFATEITQR
jgi:thiamine biosynthesis lipoprotein